MGESGIPTESAPAYDDLFENHPVNQNMPSGSLRAYAPVPQAEEDLESHHHPHHHHHHRPDTVVPMESSSTDIALQDSSSSKPHVHCETCESRMERRERRRNERHCCSMVALTFMGAFFCIMILGIVAANAVARGKRHH